MVDAEVLAAGEVHDVLVVGDLAVLLRFDAVVAGGQALAVALVPRVLRVTIAVEAVVLLAGDAADAVAVELGLLGDGCVGHGLRIDHSKQ